MNFLLVEDLPATTLQKDFVLQLSRQMQRSLLTLSALPDDIDLYIEQNEVDILFIVCHSAARRVQSLLNQCRTLRIPYVFLTDTMQHINPLLRLLLPVTMLEEEVHKVHVASPLARYTGAEVLLLQARDYGHRALQHTQKIQTALSKVNIPYQTIMGRTDSFRLYKESVDRQREMHADMVLLTASRDYGLDDLIFGPPERNAVLRSHCPVLLLNPRGDLYTLCD